MVVGFYENIRKYWTKIRKNTLETKIDQKS